MTCPSCSTENPDAARFCMGCGAALAAACATCGQANPPAARFCMHCGGSLSASSPTEPASAALVASPESYTPRHLADRILATRAGLEGERKQVTVLFADVVGSTELIQGLDPEQAKALLEPAVNAMISAVHRFEGTVCRVMGDGIMALFGAPLAHEDHAARACYAALTMQGTIRAYGAETRERDGIHVLARVGLHSGEVVVGSISNDLHVEYSAIGATTHLAARMEQLAVPGTIQLTAETLRLAEGLIEVRLLGRIPVKGLPEPVAAFELAGAGPTRRRFQAATTRGLTPFVGRTAEIEALQRALDLAAAGHGQIVAPVGDPGVGKSRLLHEFVHSRRTDGWTVLESGSVSYGKATLWLPVVDLLKSYCRIEPLDDPRMVREKLTGKLVALDSSLSSILPPLLALLGLPTDDAEWAALDAPARRRATLDALRRLLLRESQEQPLLLVFEDLHWIDAETQALLDGLVEALPTARILLLVNFRPEYTHTWGNRSFYSQLRIDPLGEQSAGALITALLGDGPALQPLRTVLVARTEGNPFFLEESIRELVETGLLEGERSAYRLTRPVEEVRVPATVQAVLAARIDRLTAREKRLLQTAAVIGKDVPFRLLQAVAETPESELHAILARLQAAELLYPVNLFPEMELTFKHALTHEVAYGGLLQERRRALHARIVEAIERLYADRLPEHVERLAHHALRAEWWERAAAYCRRAGERASVASTFQEALSWYEQALAACGRLPESADTQQQTYRLLSEIRTVLYAVGEFGRAQTYCRQAEALTVQLGDRREQALTLAATAICRWWVGEHRESIANVERALAVYPGGDPVLRTIAGFAAGQSHVGIGAYRQAIGFLRTSEIAPSGEVAGAQSSWERRAIVQAHAWLARCLAEVGELHEAMAVGESAVRMADAVRHRSVLVVACWGLGLTLVRRGDLPAAIAILERALEACRAADQPGYLPWGGSPLGYAYALAGRPAAAIPLLEETTEIGVAKGIWADQSLRIAWLAEAYLLDGRHDDAIATAQRAFDLARRYEERGNEAWIARLFGEIAARRSPPDVPGAEDQYRRALVRSEELGMRPLQAHCHVGLGKLLRRTGRADEARAELNMATAMLRKMETLHWLPEAEAELAALSETSTPAAG